MKLLLLFFLLNTISIQGIKQNATTINLSIEADYFKIDHLGNFYIVKDSRLIMLNSKGETTFEYSNSLFGDISSIDISDPLRLLLYYRESNQILFLNNKLAEISSPIELDDVDIYSSHIVCNSSQNKIWVYDSQKLQLLQYNEKMDLTLQGSNLNQIIDDVNMPDILFEKGNFIYLNIPEIGVLIFDSFGTYYKTFPKKDIIAFQVIEDYYYYQIDNSFFSYNYKKFEEKELLNTDNSTLIIKHEQAYYVLINNKIAVY